MAQRSGSVRVRYPLHAILAVAGAGLLFLFNMIVGFLFMALVPPLIPVFACLLFAGGCLVGNALEYARRVSLPAPAAMLRGRHEDEVGERRVAAPAA